MHNDAMMPPHPADEPSPAAPRAGRRRPFGLYAILALLAMQGLLGLPLVVLIVGALLNQTPALELDLYTSIDLVVTTVCVLIVLVGLWGYRRWAWTMMMFLLAYWMATDAINYFNGNPNYSSMVINVAMVFYLNQREVQRLFASQTRSQEAA